MKRRKPVARIGPYTVVSELGRGGMGVVYRARHKDINRDIALKMISQEAGATDEQIERFRREARAASKLASHPNIVGVHDVGEDEGVLYLAMDLIEGRPLDDLAAEGELTLEECARIGEQVAQALAHAHENRIFHRDIKPANILVTDHLSAHLTDFGLARAQATDASNLKLTVSGELLGTPAYMPPEQARGEDVDHRADIYSLGATLYELVSGQPPFKGESIYSVIGQVLKKPPAPLRKLNPNIPRDLETIVLTCLQKHPRARYQKAAKLADDLARFRLGASISASRSQVERGMRAGGGGVKWLAVAGVVVMAAAGGWLLTRGGDDDGKKGRGSGRSSESSKSGKGGTTSRSGSELAKAFDAVAPATAGALQTLEDHWAGAVVDDSDRESALRTVAQTTRDAAKAHKGLQLPNAWRAFARWLAGEGTAAVGSLETAAAKAADGDVEDPFPDVLMARLQLSRWAAALEVHWPRPALTQPEIIVPAFGESSVQQQWRAEAATALGRAAKVKGWKSSAAGLQYRTFAAGALALAKGDFSDAADQLARLENDDTLSGTAGFLGGAALLLADRPEDAVAALERVGRTRDWPVAWRLAGAARLAAAVEARGDERVAHLEGAERALQAARKAAPGERAALMGEATIEWIRAADIQVSGGDPQPALDRAFAVWQAYLELVPDDPVALWHQGMAFVRKADWAGHNGGGNVDGVFRSGLDALERAHRALDDDPDLVAALGETLALWGSFQVSAGQDPVATWQRANSLLDQAIAEHPEALGPRLARARLKKIWANEGRLDNDRRSRLLAEAIADLGRVLARWDGHTTAHLWRAQLENDRGLRENVRTGDPVTRFRAAIRDFTAVIEARPDDAEALRGRGGARVNMANALSDQRMDPSGAYRAAKQDLDAVLRQSPSDELAHLFRAHCCKGWARWLDAARNDPVPQYRQAIADYEFVVARNPDVVGQRINLGGTQINLGIRIAAQGDDPMPHYRAGIQTLSAALNLEPTNVTGLIFRGHGFNNSWNYVKTKPDPDLELARRALADYRAAVAAEPRAKRDLQGNIDRLTAEIAEAGE